MSTKDRSAADAPACHGVKDGLLPVTPSGTTQTCDQAKSGKDIPHPEEPLREDNPENK